MYALWSRSPSKKAFDLQKKWETFWVLLVVLLAPNYSG